MSQPERQIPTAPSSSGEVTSNSPHKPQPSKIPWKKRWRLPNILLKNGSQWFYFDDRDQYAYYDYERSIWVAIDQAMQRWDTVGPHPASLEPKQKSPAAAPSTDEGAAPANEKTESSPAPQSPQITKEDNEAWPLPEFLKNNGRQYTWAPVRDSWVYYDIQKDTFAVCGRDLKRNWVAEVTYPETQTKRKKRLSTEPTPFESKVAKKSDSHTPTTRLRGPSDSAPSPVSRPKDKTPTRPAASDEFAHANRRSADTKGLQKRAAHTGNDSHNGPMADRS